MLRLKWINVDERGPWWCLHVSMNRSKFVIVMAYRLTSPSHYPNQQLSKCGLVAFTWRQFCRKCMSQKAMLSNVKSNRHIHDDVIKWKHFPRNWPFVRRIYWSPVNSPHKGQWRGALMFSLIWVWINDWVNNREAGYLRRYRAHYVVIVMQGDYGGFNSWKILIVEQKVFHIWDKLMLWFGI